jgi:hypothetical protein
MARVSDAALDQILTAQITVAWAGETPRLKWWNTDLIDEGAGGDFFSRLTPRTHRWAALEAAREAARRADAKARGKMADPDKLRTLFFLGFELDERLADRLRARKSTPPPELPAEFTQELLGAGDIPFTVVPGGRQLKGKRPDAPEAVVARLAAALVPVADQYPMPFYKLEG